VPTNANGKQYLKNHPNVAMGVGMCVQVTDHFGHVRRLECRASVTKPLRKKH
jgi:hypothetical protein